MSSEVPARPLEVDWVAVYLEANNDLAYSCVSVTVWAHITVPWIPDATSWVFSGAGATKWWGASVEALAAPGRVCRNSEFGRMPLAACLPALTLCAGNEPCCQQRTALRAGTTTHDSQLHLHLPRLHRLAPPSSSSGIQAARSLLVKVQGAPDLLTTGDIPSTRNAGGSMFFVSLAFDLPRVKDGGIQRFQLQHPLGLGQPSSVSCANHTLRTIVAADTEDYAVRRFELLGEGLVVMRYEAEDLCAWPGALVKSPAAADPACALPTWVPPPSPRAAHPDHATAVESARAEEQDESSSDMAMCSDDSSFCASDVADEICSDDSCSDMDLCAGDESNFVPMDLPTSSSDVDLGAGCSSDVSSTFESDGAPAAIPMSSSGFGLSARCLQRDPEQSGSEPSKEQQPASASPSQPAAIARPAWRRATVDDSVDSDASSEHDEIFVGEMPRSSSDFELHAHSAADDAFDLAADSGSDCSSDEDRMPPACASTFDFTARQGRPLTPIQEDEDEEQADDEQRGDAVESAVEQPVVQLDKPAAELVQQAPAHATFTPVPAVAAAGDETMSISELDISVDVAQPCAEQTEAKLVDGSCEAGAEDEDEVELEPKPKFRSRSRSSSKLKQRSRSVGGLFFLLAFVAVFLLAYFASPAGRSAPTSIEPACASTSDLGCAAVQAFKSAAPCPSGALFGSAADACRGVGRPLPSTELGLMTRPVLATALVIGGAAQLTGKAIRQLAYLVSRGMWAGLGAAGIRIALEQIMGNLLFPALGRHAARAAPARLPGNVLGR